MNNILIYPNSLFKENKIIDETKTVYILEHNVYFRAYKYHKLKLILHRATMKKYAEYIKKKYKCKVKYIENKEIKEGIEEIIKKMKKIELYDPVDHKVEEELKRISKKYGIEIKIHETPLFITKTKELEKYYEKDKKHNHNNFYIWQRKRLNVMIKKNKPEGGRWTYDTENRERFPEEYEEDKKKNYKPRERKGNKYIEEAKRYIEKEFKKNPGEKKFYLPIDHKESERHLKKFIKERYNCFGPYQDAVNSKIPIGCHSLISPMLNIGLLTPEKVIEELIKEGRKRKIKIASIEGIIRQIIGWREYVRMYYIYERKTLEKKNELKHKKKLKKYWYELERGTDIEIIDDMIEKTKKYGYLHHIERLMYIGNYMLITKTEPKEVFKWFMISFVDSYNWVMYANVYGMSQYSAGKIMMTRPYFSSSNYITKMSDYKKNEGVIKLDKEYKWSKVWDSLYYNFINDNIKEFKKNYAISMQVRHWEKKKEEEKKEIKKIARTYIRKYLI